MKLNPSSDIEEEDEDINTTSNGKDIQSPRQDGNLNRHFRRWRYVIAIQTMTSTLKLIFETLNMPSMDLTQTLNNKKSFIHITDDKNNFLIDQLEKEIIEMETEYNFMDNPIQKKSESPENLIK